MKHNQSLEDYLESILTLASESQVVHRIDVAKKMNVSQAAVNKAVKILIDKDFVYEDGKHLYLTESGKTYAEAVYERHCVIRQFLTALGVNLACAEQDACNLEHLVSDETFSAMKKFLKNKNIS